MPGSVFSELLQRRVRIGSASLNRPSRAVQIARIRSSFSSGYPSARASLNSFFTSGKSPSASATSALRAWASAEEGRARIQRRSGSVARAGRPAARESRTAWASRSIARCCSNQEACSDSQAQRHECCPEPEPTCRPHGSFPVNRIAERGDAAGPQGATVAEGPPRVNPGGWIRPLGTERTSGRSRRGVGAIDKA